MTLKLKLIKSTSINLTTVILLSPVLKIIRLFSIQFPPTLANPLDWPWQAWEKAFMPKERMQPILDAIEKLLLQIHFWEKWLKKCHPEWRNAFRELIAFLLTLLMLAYLRLMWFSWGLVFKVYYKQLQLVLILLKLFIKVLLLPLTIPLNITIKLFKKIKNLASKRANAKNLISKSYYTIRLKYVQWQLERQVKGLGKMISAD